MLHRTLFFLAFPLFLYSQAQPAQPPTTPATTPSAAGRARSAFVNLYTVATSMLPTPRPEWVDDLNNDFPYPKSIVDAWTDAISNHAQDLDGADEAGLRKAIIDCAPKLLDGIDSLERGFRISNKPDPTPKELRETQDLYNHAREEVPTAQR